MPLLTLIIYAAQMAIYYIGGNSVMDFYNGTSQTLGITVGEISAAVTYISMICTSLMSLGMTFTNMGRAMASVGRVNEILDCEIDIVNGNLKESNNESSIEFRDVCFSYPHAKDSVLKNISFKINKGETIAIVGSTGCGKSTLVGLLVRFYDVNCGQILVDGIDVKDYDLNVLRNKIGLVLQKSELFAQTIKENIKWGKNDATDDEVILAAKIAQAHDFISAKELGYDEFVEEKGTSLSGGQKQRLSIARAILKKPEIIVFDDATSALDLVTEAKLHQGLHNYMADSIKIIVAQRIATAKNADKIIVLDNGIVSAFDTHENLLKTSTIYQDIYNSQLKKAGVYDE
jgi:ATP-binding cassette subfamily B protein